MSRKGYAANKPLYNSVLFGCFYCIFTLGLDNEKLGLLYVIVMLFLPGITFPLSTTYFQLPKMERLEIRITAHFLLSIGIYYGAVWLFSADGPYSYFQVLAGFSGSLLYLLCTRFLLYPQMPVLGILATSALSGMSFLLVELMARGRLPLGLSIFLWTIVNGFFMNKEWKRHQILLVP